MTSFARRRLGTGLWVAALLLAAAPARAAITGFEYLRIDGVDVTLDSRIGKLSSDTTHVINFSDCKLYAGAYVNLFWSISRSPVPASPLQYAVKLSRPGGSCSTADLTTIDTSCREISASGKVTADGQEVKVMLSLDKITGACVSGIDQQTTLSIVVDEASVVGGTGIASETIVFQVDQKPPSPVVVNAPLEGDSNITVSWKDDQNSGESSVKYRVYWSPDALTDANKASATVSDDLTEKSYQITDLTNGLTYNAGVTAVDVNDNESTLPATAICTGMPVVVQDFFQLYKSAGGKDMGGFCAMGRSPGAAAGTGVLVALGLAFWGFATARRRNGGRA